MPGGAAVRLFAGGGCGRQAARSGSRRRLRVRLSTEAHSVCLRRPPLRPNVGRAPCASPRSSSVGIGVGCAAEGVAWACAGSSQSKEKILSRGPGEVVVASAV
eukprot:NODE_18393_length_895_cov_4.855469.p3 GENE.NODE_18393_length_895_cov_4.855469~~NODE_18393_length_895_cov_4.855469.p3  ORF type:complete len:103 (+),score=9.64 NODE_18393_length_895_cov_4.855469:342-650(+)